MRALRLLALAAALVAPAAAAHAQVGVYVGPSPAYGAASGYWVPGHWSDGPDGRFWLGPHWRGDRYGWHQDWREDWRGHRAWFGHRGRDRFDFHRDHGDRRW